MGIKINSNFTVQAPVALDERQVLTFEAMLAINDAVMPDVYFAVCSEDQKLYVYNKANEMDEVTGKFRLAEAATTLYRTMPDAATMPGAIIQYIGENVTLENNLDGSSLDVKKGYFYESVSHPANGEEYPAGYHWEAISTQAVELPHYTTLPGADDEYYYNGLEPGAVVQYVGDNNVEFEQEDGTTLTLVKGYFYELTENSETGMYEWKQLDTQPDFVSIHVEEMPDPADYASGSVVQNLGPTTDKYTRGYFYENISVDYTKYSDTDGNFFYLISESKGSPVFIKADGEYTKFSTIRDITAAADNNIVLNAENTDGDRITLTLVGDTESVHEWSQIDIQPDFTSIHVEEMPVANADREGEVLQYLGANTDDYIRGYFYECRKVDGAWKWVNLKTQADFVSIHVEEMPNADDYEHGYVVQNLDATDPNYTRGFFYECVADEENVGHNKWKQLDTQPDFVSIHVEEMPVANADRLGEVLQYLGESDDTYTKGFFYECKNVAPAPEGDEEVEPVYKWVELQSQSDSNCKYSSEDTNINLDNLKTVSAEDMADMDFHKFMQIINYAKSEIKLSVTGGQADAPTVFLRDSDSTVSLSTTKVNKSSAIVDDSIKFMNGDVEITDGIEATSTMTIHAVAELEDGKAITSNSVTAYVVSPIMDGVWNEGNYPRLSDAVKEECNAVICAPTKTHKVTFTSDNKKLIIAIPTVDYPDGIKKILDPNGFDNTASFELVATEEIATRRVGSHKFAVYVSKTPVTCTDFTYTISL